MMLTTSSGSTGARKKEFCVVRTRVEEFVLQLGNFGIASEKKLLKWLATSVGFEILTPFFSTVRLLVIVGLFLFAKLLSNFHVTFVLFLGVAKII